MGHILRKFISKRFISTFLAAVLAFGAFAAAPFAAYADGSPFQVVMQPIGAVYWLNEAAAPLKASFAYDALAGFGHLYSDAPMSVRWYWSYDNSNASRANAWGPASGIAYSRQILHTTTTVPDTSKTGIKYYYAVVTYSESVYEEPAVAGIAGESKAVPREAVTNPARIEVRARTQSFRVRKTDEEGNLLSGAVIELAPAGGDASDPSAKTYEETTSGGFASFTAEEGEYVLSEKTPPDGYEGSDAKYRVIITADGVYINNLARLNEIVQNVTFVNKKKPPAEPTPTPPGRNATPTPTPTPGTSPTPTPTPGTSPNPTLTSGNEASSTPTPAPAISPLPSVSPAPAPGANAGAQSFRVKKTDADGNLLSGAVFSLIPDSGYTQPAGAKPYEATAANGYASFSPAAGQYVLSEKLAPAGYNASADKYTIRVTKDGVWLVNPGAGAVSKYETLTYVNKKIPFLNKEDHFAFMQGYPEGDFRPEKNMTRAEAVVMFSRLLSESMDLTADHRNDCYPDVEYNNPSMLQPWYANQVCYMHSLGVLADYSRDANFRPDDPVSRAEFATLAAHFDNLKYTEKNNFSDVPPDHWAVKYINSAEAKGWITGYPDGTFKPEANITRAEVVTLVGRMLDRSADKAYLTHNAASLPRNYWDFAAAHWAHPMIYEASIGHDYIKDDAGEHWTAVY